MAFACVVCAGKKKSCKPTDFWKKMVTQIANAKRPELIGDGLGKSELSRSTVPALGIQSLQWPVSAHRRWAGRVRREVLKVCPQ